MIKCIILFSLLIMYATQVLTELYKTYTKRKNHARLIALVITLIGVFCLNINLFTVFGFAIDGIISQIFTLIISGICLSRGSNFFHWLSHKYTDVLKSTEEIKNIRNKLI